MSREALQNHRKQWRSVIAAYIDEVSTLSSKKKKPFHIAFGYFIFVFFVFKKKFQGYTCCSDACGIGFELELEFRFGLGLGFGFGFGIELNVDLDLDLDLHLDLSLIHISEPTRPY